jgi:hypothetical protein
MLLVEFYRRLCRQFTDSKMNVVTWSDQSGITINLSNDYITNKSVDSTVYQTTLQYISNIQQNTPETLQLVSVTEDKTEYLFEETYPLSPNEKRGLFDYSYALLESTSEQLSNNVKELLKIQISEQEQEVSFFLNVEDSSEFVSVVQQTDGLLLTQTEPEQMVLIYSLTQDECSQLTQYYTEHIPDTSTFLNENCTQTTLSVNISFSSKDKTDTFNTLRKLTNSNH